VNKRISIEELNIQREYIAKMQPIVGEIAARRGSAPKMYIGTFGCQMNAHDSEKLQGMLEEMGYESTDKESEADFVIYNTCCVRENAENKVYGNLGYLKHQKKSNPDMRIALCGCMMQEPEVIETIRNKYKQVDLVFGTFNLYKLPELMYRQYTSGSQIFDIWDKHGEIIEDLPSVRKYKFKASVNIMFGCDNFCSYCIVPYVRGRERSRRPEDIVREIKGLVADGVKEITLLGQNVNSYGKGLDTQVSFAELLRQVNEIEGLERIRFMTSHPKDLSDELIYAMRDCDKVCKHIHLPFQAGNDEILRRMNRRYTREHYLELVAKLRREIPDIAITTDIIVGFPGEGKDEVLDTVEVIKAARFSGAFTFIYSKRTGTPAAKMEQVDPCVAKENFNLVLEALNPIILELNRKKLGKTYKVLAEEVNPNNPELLTGRLEDNSLVHFKADRSLIGTLFDIKITDCKTFYLMGEKL
jgi:tRNA-2-methylthio-N6-dimethylallyladenosine synthase